MTGYSEVRPLPVDRLVVSPQQARTRGIERDLDELVENIRVHGQLEPVIVAPVPGSDERYEIIAGQRRWLAMQRLGAETIYAAILSEAVDEATASVLSVSENLVRRDLDPKDLIDACTRLYHKYGSIKAVSEELGLPYNNVRSYVKFDRLRPELKKRVEAGDLDVKGAIRIEDHFGEEQVDEGEIEQIVKEVSEMTNAQQREYFATRHSQPNGPVANGTQTNADPITQIIVTLRSRQVALLRQWAKGRGLTQDKAAATVIGAFLDSQLARHERPR